MSTYLSPLIDRELFFGNPQISGAQLSPDGKYISFIKPVKDVMNIWVVAVDDPFEDALPVTSDQSRPIRSYFWSRDSRYIIFEQDKGGDENFRIYRVNPEDAKKDLIPDPVDLTPYDNIRAVIFSLPRKEENKIFVGINDRDPAWHDIYAIDLDTGVRSLIYQNEAQLSDVCFDLNGQLRLASRSLPDGGTEILKKENKHFTKILEANLEESLNPVRFHVNNDQVYFISNIGSPDRIGLYLYHMDTAKMVLVDEDPLGEVDLEDIRFSPSTEELIATIYTGDKKRVYWMSETHEADYAYLKNHFKDTEIDITSTTKNESLWIIYVSDDRDSGRAYLFDRTDKQLKFLYQPRPELNKDELVRMSPVSFASFDGLMIPAYLSLPNVSDQKNLPAVILVHGGPWARDYWGYNGFAQFLANRGYAVLQINFRGSTGYGKSFLNAAINEWGEKMQDDLSAGAKYLISQGIADAQRIAIMGGSYGGYATLAGLTFTPELYAAGVSIVGPSNLFTLLETIPPYWESARTMFYKRMGNPNTDEGRTQLRRQSPFFHAKNIRVPLMVAQGANDPRVKKSESDQIVIAMRKLNLEVEYLNFPDEGHGFANPRNNMAFIAAMEKFLAKHIGGRYQTEIPSSLMEILDRVTVDTDTLEMPLIVTDELRSRKLPMPTKKINNNTHRYTATLNFQDQELNFDMDRSIRLEESKIFISDESKSPMGTMSDSAVMDKYLKVAERKIDQAPLNIDIKCEENSVQGHMQMDNQSSDIDISYEYPFIHDGPVQDLYISALTLKKGDTLYLNILDLQSQKFNLFELSFIAMEIIDGINTNHILLKSLEGPEKSIHYWLEDSDNALMVQKQFNIPEMGGARMFIKWQGLVQDD